MRVVGGPHLRHNVLTHPDFYTDTDVFVLLGLWVCLHQRV